MLVLVAVIMVVLLGSAALAIDVGSFYGAQRKAQSAADAAALAAVQDLPSNTVQATTDVHSYVARNYPGATASIITPYNGSSGAIKVTVTANTPAFLSQIWGKTSQNVSASAAAGGSSGSSPGAVFAGDTSCGGRGITMNGNNNTVIGGTHSDGSLTLNGNNDSFGDTRYGGPNGCSDTVNGMHLTFGGSDTPLVDPRDEPFPIDYRKSPPACTFSGTDFSWNDNNFNIDTGVYCASHAITLNGNNLGGTVTLIAPSITINGNNVDLKPDANGLLFWYTGTGSITVNGNNLEGGTVFAPTGTIILNGNNAQTTGFVEGNDVLINGNNWQITGNGPVMPSGGTSLIQ